MMPDTAISVGDRTSLVPAWASSLIDEVSHHDDGVTITGEPPARAGPAVIPLGR
jgi:hypothetical protein